MKVSRILAPTDFSRHAGFALEWAAYLADSLKAELILLHVIPEEEGKVIEEFIGGVDFVRIPVEVRQGALEERKKKIMDQMNLVLPNDLMSSIPVKRILRIGVPFVEIIKAAKEEQVDVIVLSSFGRTGLTHVLMGSVAQKVVHQAPC